MYKIYEHKFLFGIFKNYNKLIGIIDIVKDFPFSTQWMLGLMLIDPDHRGKGLGKMVHGKLMEWAGNLGAESFRIGVIEDNIKGLNFWNNLAYQKIKDTVINSKNKRNNIYVMTLDLQKILIY